MVWCEENGVQSKVHPGLTPSLWDLDALGLAVAQAA